MDFSALVLQWEEEALQQGFQEEVSQEEGSQKEDFMVGFKRSYQKSFLKGVRNGRRTIIENFLRARFGDLDDELSGIIEPLLELSSEEFAVLLLQLSREELLARFGG